MKKLDLTIGARVYCRDGKFGKLVKVVVEPETQCVKSLVVEKGFLSKRSRIFPISLVSVTTTDEVHMLLKNDEWESYPVYKEEEFEELPVSWEEQPLEERPSPKSETTAVQTAIQNRDPYEMDGGNILIMRD